MEADFEHNHAGVNETNANAPAPSDWNFADGIPGTGERPDWFKGDKYKSVADQAKAYADVEKRMHEQSAEINKYKTAAPEKYDWKELKDVFGNNPHMTEFAEVMRQHGVPQESFEVALEKLVDYDLSRMPNQQAEIQKLGPDADKKLEILSQWAANELPQEFHDTFGKLTATAEAVQMFDAMRQKMTSLTSINPPVNGQQPTSAPTKMSRAEVQAEMNANAKKYETNAAYRAEIREKLAMTIDEGGFTEQRGA